MKEKKKQKGPRMWVRCDGSLDHWHDVCVSCGLQSRDDCLAKQSRLRDEVMMLTESYQLARDETRTAAAQMARGVELRGRVSRRDLNEVKCL